MNLAFSSALEQARLIRKGEISPLELTQLYLDRIQQLNPQLGSFVTIDADGAIADAKGKTEQLARESDRDSLPPFFGVPTAIKDLNAVAGLPQMLGTLALKDNIPTYDDGVVAKIRGAGFTILGKTATPELGSFPYTEPPGFPPARNPWNLDYTPGGSSGGSAAAVAAGLCAVAQGSDGGGSIRTPASCCRVVGLKPSRGRVTHAPVGDFQNGIATDGMLTRTVADAAALLDVISGYVTGDPYWLPDPEVSFLESSRRSRTTLRIGFAIEMKPLDRPSEICQNAVLNTVKHLQTLGHHLEEIHPDFTALETSFTRVWQGGIASAGLPPEALSPLNRWLMERAGTAGEYLQAVTKMQVVSRQIVDTFAPYDAILFPVHTHSPIRIGEWAQLSPEETVAKIIQWVGPCPVANASGLPAIALPATFDEQGLPIAIQLIGKPAGEATILALATQLEAVNPWNDRPPEAVGSRK
ncbi:MAG: amidase [Cyanobacteria bacterium SBLK]|nr:amidase [Cyanobacteria bacterium SBLK]